MSCIPLERSINQFQNKTNHSKSKFVTKIKYFDFIGQLCKSWLLAIFPLLTCAVTFVNQDEKLTIFYAFK